MFFSFDVLKFLLIIHLKFAVDQVHGYVNDLYKVYMLNFFPWGTFVRHDEL